MHSQMCLLVNLRSINNMVNKLKYPTNVTKRYINSNGYKSCRIYQNDTLFSDYE